MAINKPGDGQGGGSPGTGTCTDCDDRFVNRSGDTMTGQLKGTSVLMEGQIASTHFDGSFHSSVVIDSRGNELGVLVQNQGGAAKFTPSGIKDGGGNPKVTFNSATGTVYIKGGNFGGKDIILRDSVEIVGKGISQETADSDSDDTLTTKAWVLSKVSGGGDKNFIYESPSSSSVWVIEHNLNKKPSVLVHDSAGTEIVGSVVYDDLDNLTITFSAPFVGEAVLN